MTGQGVLFIGEIAVGVALGIGIAFVGWRLLLAQAARRWVRGQRWEALRATWADPVAREFSALPEEDRQRREHEFAAELRRSAEAMKDVAKIYSLAFRGDSPDPQTAVRLKALDTLPSALIAECFGRSAFTNEGEVKAALVRWLLEHPDEARVWRLANPQGFGYWAESLGPGVIRTIWPSDFPDRPEVRA